MSNKNRGNNEGNEVINNSFNSCNKIGENFEGYKSILYELFDNGITEEKFNELKKKSHYYLAKSLHGLIPSIEKFSSSNRDLKSCYKGDLEFVIMGILPQIFASFKELFVGKSGNSRANCLNRIRDEDIRSLGLSGIRILNGPMGMSDKKLISEIRNALEHTQYIVGGEGLYVNNPINPGKHEYNFVAYVPFDFILDFLDLIAIKSQKILFGGINIDDQNFRYSGTYDFNEVKDIVHFSKNVMSPHIGAASAPEIVSTEIILTPKLKQIIGEYFDNHKANGKNLIHVANALVYPPEEVMYIILKYTFCYRYHGLKDNKLVDDVYHTFDNGQILGYHTYLHTLVNTKEYKILNDLLYKICKKKQPNGQSILKHHAGMVDFTLQYLQKNGFVHNEEKDSWEKHDFVITNETLLSLWSNLTQTYNLVEHGVNMFPNWLKMQFIKSVYINQLIPIDNEESTRLRNALAHNRYIMLDGVDNIVFFDAYNKDSDTYGREEIYSLSSLYEDTRNKMNAMDDRITN